MNQVCPERITQARELCCLSKTDLAEKLGVSPAAVAQWESDAKNPTPENLFALANALMVPMSFFMREFPSEVARKGPLMCRAWSSAQTRRNNKRSERMAELVAEIYRWLDSMVTLPRPALPEVSLGDGSMHSIFEAATACRRAWGLGDKPLLKLGELLESKGIIIASVSIGDERFDAYSCVMNGRPFVFLGNEKGDKARSRFDGSHELGHLIMHQHLSEADLRTPAVHRVVETQADQFAAAFLMPPDSFQKDLLDTSLRGFQNLKLKWGVSIQAMVRHSYNLGVLSERTYTELFRQMSAKGWRKAKGEPFDEMMPSVQGTLANRSLKILAEAGVLQPWQIMDALQLPATVVCDTFDMAADELAPAVESKILQMPTLFDTPKSSRPLSA